jgi:hypothetical protein
MEHRLLGVGGQGDGPLCPQVCPLAESAEKGRQQRACEAMIDFIFWLLWRGFLLAVGAYFVFVALAIVLKTARFLLAYVRDSTGRFIRTASFNLALWTVRGCQYGSRRAGEALASLFRPLIERIEPEDPEEKMRELAALSNSLKGAREILGLPEKFSRDDLNEIYRRRAKQVAPESGGTEGLLRAVNLARDVLKAHAS